jgi:flap endonuclease-1
MKLISDNAPNAIKECDISTFFGRKVAVDASMSLYQFLIAIRMGPEGSSLTNESGEVTSHLQGMLYRTIRMMEHGIKPAFVFDGKPPELKGGELEKRREKRNLAQAELKIAEEKEDMEAVAKQNKRLVRVTKEQNEDAKKVLRLMGMPIVEAPCEAEAQAAALCKAGLVYATATEDMDALTFGTTKLLRHLSAPASAKKPCVEVDLVKALEGLELTMDQFVDMCVMCGCDYTNTIRGIGPKRSLELIKKHGSTKAAVESIDPAKHTVPVDFLHAEAAKLFHAPEITDPKDITLKWTAPDEAGLMQFLVAEKGFAADRVKSAIARLNKARTKGGQKRMDSFFGMKAAPSADQSKKRKADALKAKKASTKKKPAAKKAKK